MTTDKPGAVALLPCPFCGEDAEHASVRDGRQVFCPYCFAKGPPAYHGPANIPTAQERAVDGWNHRAAVAPAVSAQDKPGAEAAKAAHKIQLCTFEDGPEQAIAIIQAAINAATAAVEAERDDAVETCEKVVQSFGEIASQLFEAKIALADAERERDAVMAAARELSKALDNLARNPTNQYAGKFLKLVRKHAPLLAEPPAPLDAVMQATLAIGEAAAQFDLTLEDLEELQTSAEAIRNTAARLDPPVDPVAFAEACQDGELLAEALNIAAELPQWDVAGKLAALKRAEPSTYGPTRSHDGDPTGDDEEPQP